MYIYIYILHVSLSLSIYIYIHTHTYTYPSKLCDMLVRDIMHYKYRASAKTTPALREAMLLGCFEPRRVVASNFSKHVSRRVCGHFVKPCSKHSSSGYPFVMYYRMQLAGHSRSIDTPNLPTNIVPTNIA